MKTAAITAKVMPQNSFSATGASSFTVVSFMVILARVMVMDSHWVTTEMVMMISMKILETRGMGSTSNWSGSWLLPIGQVLFIEIDTVPQLGVEDVAAKYGEPHNPEHGRSHPFNGDKFPDGTAVGHFYHEQA